MIVWGTCTWDHPCPSYYVLYLIVVLYFQYSVLTCLSWSLMFNTEHGKEHANIFQQNGLCETETKLMSMHKTHLDWLDSSFSGAFPSLSHLSFNDLHVLASVHPSNCISCTFFTPKSHSSPWSMLLCTHRYSCVLFPVLGILFPLHYANEPSPNFKSRLVPNSLCMFYQLLHYILFFIFF